MMHRNFFLKTYFFLIIYFIATMAHAMEHYTKQWTVATVFGSFPESKWRYYLEPQLRLIDNRYVFNQFLFLFGLGYQITPNMMFFTGPGWIANKNPQGIESNDVRIWQQLNWNVLQNSFFSLNSRTRLEETTRNTSPGIAFQGRQRLWVRFPFKQWETYSLSMFDEVFLNFNHPNWVSKDLFSQNRAFIGIGKQVSKYMMLDIGYLNQYILAEHYQQNNVFLISLSIIN